jgi:hypothetical protein
MDRQDLECWGTTYIDFQGNFSETEPQKWAVKYCYFESKQNSCSGSKDGILVFLSESTTRKDIHDLAHIVNEKRPNCREEHTGINYTVLEDLKQQINGSDVLAKREYELYRKKHD